MFLYLFNEFIYIYSTIKVICVLLGEIFKYRKYQLINIFKKWKL